MLDKYSAHTPTAVFKRKNHNYQSRVCVSGLLNTVQSDAAPAAEPEHHHTPVNIRNSTFESFSYQDSDGSSSDQDDGEIVFRDDLHHRRPRDAAEPTHAKVSVPVSFRTITQLEDVDFTQELDKAERRVEFELTTGRNTSLISSHPMESYKRFLPVLAPQLSVEDISEDILDSLLAKLPSTDDVNVQAKGDDAHVSQSLKVSSGNSKNTKKKNQKRRSKEAKEAKLASDAAMGAPNISEVRNEGKDKSAVTAPSLHSDDNTDCIVAEDGPKTKVSKKRTTKNKVHSTGKQENESTNIMNYTTSNDQVVVCDNVSELSDYEPHRKIEEPVAEEVQLEIKEKPAFENAPILSTQVIDECSWDVVYQNELGQLSRSVPSPVEEAYMYEMNFSRSQHLDVGKSLKEILSNPSLTILSIETEYDHFI